VFRFLCHNGSDLELKNRPKWRRATKEKKERQEAERGAKAGVGGEKG
jgi:hypothetical protein